MLYFLDMSPTGRMEEILTEGSIKSMNKSISTFLVNYSSEKGDATHPSTGTKKFTDIDAPFTRRRINIDDDHFLIALRFCMSLN